MPTQYKRGISYLIDSSHGTPAHDALCLWIRDNAPGRITALHAKHDPYAKRNYWQDICDAAVQNEIRRLQKDHSDYRKTEREQRILDLDDVVRDLPPPEPPPAQTITTALERPVYRQTGKTIAGFLDVAVTIALPALTVNGLYETEIYNSFPRAYAWCVEDDKIPSFGWRLEKHHYAFEAKPEIRSLGELLRQMQGYRELLPYTLLTVVSPDVRYMDDIKKEGFQFWESPLSLYS